MALLRMLWEATRIAGRHDIAASYINTKLIGILCSVRWPLTLDMLMRLYLSKVNLNFGSPYTTYSNEVETTIVSVTWQCFVALLVPYTAEIKHNKV